MGFADRDYYRQGQGRPPGRLAGAPVTKWLLISNVVLWLLDVLFQTETRTEIVPSVLHEWGYFSVETVFHKFQVWRILSFQFVHGHLGHVAMNMWGLFLFGPFVERWLRSRPYLWYYLLCGIAGALFYALLAAMPGLGVMKTNFITDKHHEALRYYMLAAPGWAGLLILGIAALYRFRGALGQAAWAGSLLALLSVANWGYAVSHYQGKTVYNTFSSMYSSHDNADSVIVAGMGYRPGNTSALLYALPPHANIFILQSEVKAQEIIDLIDPYENVWLIRVGETTVNIEDELARALKDSGRTSEKFLQIEHYTRRD
mgnify:CR=1 FL=1